MIDKSGIAESLSIDDDKITDSVYSWALSQFFSLTGLSSVEEQRTCRKFIGIATSYFIIPDINIKSVDTLLLDGVEASVSLYTNLKFNPDTGLLFYSSGFSVNTMVEITYTINAVINKPIYDYLLSLLVSKSISIFTPSSLEQIKMIKIGKFQKQFGGISPNLESHKRVIDNEIDLIVDEIKNNIDNIGYGVVI